MGPNQHRTMFPGKIKSAPAT